MEDSGDGAARLVACGAMVFSFLSVLYGLLKILTNVVDTRRKPIVFVACALQLALFSLNIVICFRLTLGTEQSLRTLSLISDR